MKLIVQIPCYNEAETLPATVAAIPREIEGIDTVEVLIVDDGSNDRTVEVAKECGVDHIVQHSVNRGLAATFTTGLDACVRRGADIIVNTDGDGQYKGECIPDLVRPILNNEQELVVGERPIEEITDFSPLKKRLQRFGSRVVQRLSGVVIPDATSGFRAMTRDVALRLNIISRFTYTLETLIQCGDAGISVGSVKIKTNPKTRPSRLFKGTFQYLWRSLWTITRIYTRYRPLRIFWPIGGVLFLMGVLLGMRYLYLMAHDTRGQHIQSLLLGAIFTVVGIQTVLSGLLADMVASNRRIAEETLYRERRRDSNIQ